MSGWTRTLQSSSSNAAAPSSSPSSSVASELVDEADAYFQGQPYLPSLSQRFSSLLTTIANPASADSLTAQQTLLDQLRQGLEGEGDAVTAPSTQLVSTLSSFAHALHAASSFTLLPAQYQRLVDTLSFDLCDLLLPALGNEWHRVAGMTLRAHAQAQVDATLQPLHRPVSSAVLTLLLHLLDQIATHAAPREVALALMAFYQSQVQVSDVEPETEETGEDEEGDSKHDPSSAAPAVASVQSSFYRLCLSLPLLDVMSVVVSKRDSTDQTARKQLGATGTGGQAATSSTPKDLSLRQIDLFQQLIEIVNQTLLTISNRLARMDSSERERPAWASLQSSLAQKVVAVLEPPLELIARSRKAEATAAAAAAATPTPSIVVIDDSSSSSSSPTAPVPPSPLDSLRLRILSFLFLQLFHAQSCVTDGLVMTLQDIWQGNTAFKERLEQQNSGESKQKQEKPSSSLTPALVPHLSLFFTLISTVDRCCVSPTELCQWFHARRDAELRVDEEELKSWDEEGGEEDENAPDMEEGWEPRNKEGKRTGAKGEEEEDFGGGAEPSGNAGEDERDSGDEDENAAVAAHDAAVAKEREARPVSTLRRLRDELKALPDFSAQGIGVYQATVLSYQYFYHVRAKRKAAMAAAASGSAASSSTALSAHGDQQLEEFFAAQPNVGAGFLSQLLAMPPTQLLDSVAPFLCSLLLHSLSIAQLSFLLQGIGALTAVWSLLPPSCVYLLTADSPPLEDSGAWMFSETLLQIAYLIPRSWSTLRSSLLHAWKSLLSCLSASSRHALLQQSLSSCSVPSVQAIILARLKEEIVREYEQTAPGISADDDEPRLLTPDLLASLHAHLVQLLSAVGVSRGLDFLLALLNLFLFLVLKERAEASIEADAQAAATSSLPWPLRPKGGRLGLRQAAVLHVWRSQWNETANQLKEEVRLVEMDEQELREAGGTVDPAELKRIALLRNQLQLAVDLCERLLQHMQ